MNKKILLSIDVEDWFQVENFKPWIPFSSWISRESRVEKNTHLILDLLDSVQLRSSDCEQKSKTGIATPKATFFVLGWIAERFPNLVREIYNRGHEIASHGYNHYLCNQLSAFTLKNDVVDSKKLLENIIGAPVFGYRAPNFSVNANVIQILQQSGYLYDSSYNSFDLNSRYGIMDFSRFEKRGVAYRYGKSFYEIPISNLIIGRKRFSFPMGGGGYFRILPLFFFKMGVRRILSANDAYAFYIHPWEFDPQQPRVEESSFSFKFRHYINLKSTYPKLCDFIEFFRDHRFATYHEYVESV